MKISAAFPLSFFVSLIIAPHYNFIHINNCWQSPGSLLLIWIYLSKFFSFSFHSSKKWLEYTKGSSCEAKHLKLIWILQIQWIKSWIIFVFFSFKSLLKKLTNTPQIAENSILFWKECSWMGSSLSHKKIPLKNTQRVFSGIWIVENTYICAFRIFLLYKILTYVKFTTLCKIQGAIPTKFYFNLLLNKFIILWRKFQIHFQSFEYNLKLFYTHRVFKF